VAAGESGVVTSTRPTGGPRAWKFAAGGHPYFFLEGVSCPSVSFCVAVDFVGNVETSSRSAGGSSAWTKNAVDGTNPLAAVSCPTAGLCVGVGDPIATNDPNDGSFLASSEDPTGGVGAWRVADGVGAVSVSCPSVSLCVGGDAAGDIVSTTDPTGGARAWRVVNVLARQTSCDPYNGCYTGYATIAGVSCPSTGLCVAAGAFFVVSSTNPTGDARAWRRARVDAEANNLRAVSCPSASLCVAVDDHGNAVTSTNPTGGPQAWPAGDGRRRPHAHRRVVLLLDPVRRRR